VNVADVMDEVATRLEALPGLRGRAVPGERATPPCAVTSYPEDITFDATYGRGMDTVTLPVLLVVGESIKRSTRDALAAYTAGSGERSVKAALDAPGWTSCDDVRVREVEFQPVKFNGVDFMGAWLVLEIMGRGAAP
jgi:hypothetical protein